MATKRPAKPPPQVTYTPRNPLQHRLRELLPASHLVILDGEPGTGKTAGAFGEALLLLVRDEIDRIILARPPVPCGPGIGFLTGDLTAKMTPWLSSVADAMRGFTDLSFARLGKRVEIADLGMIQGRTVRNEILIVDEAQNLFDRQQLVCLATRVGEGGKVILCGDPAQSNLRRPGPVPFARFAQDHRHTPGVAVITATRDDQLRSGFVKTFLEAEERLTRPGANPP